MHLSFEKILNVSLRSATLITRFLFIFYLAKYLDPASVGYYGLFTAAIGYALYFVGLDFYTYATREILKAPIGQRGQMLKGQATLSGVLYIIIFPVVLVFLSQVDWPGQMPWWFFPLLFLDHFNQELSRLMVALSQQIAASVINFVRQGSWAIATVLLLNFHIPSRKLDTILALWTVAGLVAAGMGIRKLQQMNMGGWRSSVDWQWIKKGILVSGAFLLATLALRSVNTFDRYWIEALGGIDMVAAYVLLLGVAGTLMTFLDACVFSYAYPALIQHHHNHEHEQGRARVRQVIWQTATLSGAFALVSLLLLPYLLRWIDNPVYLEAAHFYPWLLLATVLNALGMAPHYGLYALGHDKPLIYSQCACLVFFVASTWLLSEHFGSMAVPLGLNIAFALMLLLKSSAYWGLMKKSSI
jgi:O-antigen/teichoic acid export membrane protein